MVVSAGMWRLSGGYVRGVSVDGVFFFFEVSQWMELGRPCELLGPCQLLLVVTRNGDFYLLMTGFPDIYYSSSNDDAALSRHSARVAQRESSS